ncbi:hypothetical protein GFC01_01465 [Desulfofundulus thermobenzoicus]|uniref:Transcription factor zinc-finger domain-containing protein n=1 Tax=Desulfofundulus thermobenzoicus TaxID=29376 RepID=A0A6N7IMX5_9FIRM|nr:zf-TFIIB domain-containing protein [Desulfofundulus thermobenzoicus]MQL50959.1 hypothetical protein [Desulfofundulus thermobenzoicus]HHW42871.1 hypothetical protein [Desulfotomaculum sp.]
MKDCPVCHMPLREVPRYGVMMDVCPRCRGVWLDGGELEKVVSLSRKYRDEYEHYPEGDYQREFHHDKDHHYDYHHDYHKHKKKRGFFDLFEDLFD